MAVAQAFAPARLSGPRPARQLAASSHRLQHAAAARPASRGASLRVRADLDPDNASFLVAGGGGVALEVTRQLKDMGSWVWQLQRTDVRRKEIEGMMAIVAKGDAMNPAEVEKAMAQIDGLDAVVSTIGGTVAEPAADSQGNINLMEAAVKAGVKKFVLVTSIGCGESKAGTPPNVYEALAPILKEKEKAEARLRELGGQMEFVIVRPGGLKSEPATGQGVLTEDPTVCGAIARSDVATLVIKALLSDKASGKTLSAVDRGQLMTPQPFEELKL